MNMICIYIYVFKHCTHTQTHTHTPTHISGRQFLPVGGSNMSRVDTKQPIISQETLLTPAAFHCDDSFLTLCLAEEHWLKIWGVPKTGTPIAGWFTVSSSKKNDSWGYPPFSETSIS